MKAVNLIPADQRRGAGGAAGRAGGAVYVLLGALGLLVVMSVLYAVSASRVSDRQSQLNTVSAQADVVQSQATALQPYVSFAAIRQTREQAIASIAASRFDWSAAMDQIARALPNNVTLSALSGGPSTTAATTTAPATPAAAASGPAVTLTGCATGHSQVASVLVALRAIQGVTGVSLATSTRPNPTAPPTCPKGATFSTTLAYGSSAAGTTTTPTTNGVTAATATSPTAGSTR